jgi:hypothetical protein
MTTRAQLRSIIREILSNDETWSESTINAWIAEAIRDYSTYFPRHVEATINCVDDTVEYSLTSYTGILDVLRVEYPDGEEPPRYLERRAETGTFEDLPVYDVRGDPPVTLVIGEEPDTGEDIILTYSATHTIVTDDDTALTVRDEHFEAIRLFVQWKAIQGLEMEEARDPDTTSILLSMLGLNSGRAERLYWTKIGEYIEHWAPGGYGGPWRMDDSDRVY